MDRNRRVLWTRTLIKVASGTVGAAGVVACLAAVALPVWASSSTQKSRSTGYTVQKSDQEWREKLSSTQYEILRNGGTERPGFSILESEKRPGTFHCAGCDTPLFQTKDKFQSGTGWPSFARSLPGGAVEIETINPFMKTMSGAEIRCSVCGGHLGDVFQDGFLFVGTEAARTGQRFCVDGAALVFYPENKELPLLRGDVPKPKEVPSWLEPPKIVPRD